MLNSNKQFELDDPFTLSFVHVLRPAVGTGWKWTYLPGHQASTRLKQFKRCVVTVPQDDTQLCAPWAIVVARGLHLADNDDNQRKKWIRSNQNTHLRDQAARALLGQVGLRPRAYGPDELTLVATARIFTVTRSSWSMPIGSMPVSLTGQPLPHWDFYTKTVITMP